MFLERRGRSGGLKVGFRVAMKMLGNPCSSF